MVKYDFCGYCTRNDLKCSDGRTIRKNAFKDNDGQSVPLVWNHMHNDASNILGHALLENREDGVYAYGVFNDTEEGLRAKALVEHKDITQMSIYANKLKQSQGDVLHGAIREVSLVFAGANPGAYIESVMSHSDSGEPSEDEGIVYTGEDFILHADCDTKQGDDTKKEKEKPMAEEKEKPAAEDKTLGDVFNTLTEEQKTVVYAIVGQALEEKGKASTAEHSDNEDEEGETIMKHNVFDQDEQDNENVISHADMEAVISDAKRYGSMKDSALAHGITNIDYLFPEAETLNKTPEFIARDMDWVTDVMNGVHHTPFSRIKSMFANLTADEARAKGYVKGNLKTEEVFSLLKRSTTPTTVYKKQKLDRDDVVDIVDFDVVAWLKSEMRMMLNEELARAFLVGDGRIASSDDKINEQNIRPIWTDADLYTIKKCLTFAAAATNDQKAKAFIQECVKARKDYKGSGNPILFTTEDILNDCLLMEDTTGRIIYKNVGELATALRVSKIVTTPIMENLTRTVDGATHNLMAIIVNLNDYNVGADKGGAVNMFDDFDIDYNQQKYLIETRCSGALTKPYSAIVIENKAGV